MSNAPISDFVIPRPTCDRCRRPRSVCTCAHLVSLPTRTRVLLLQHPRERYVPVGTARLAHLCLPNSELRIGLDFHDDATVAAAVKGTDGAPPAYLLFPGPDAVDLAEARLPGPITLVVIDGTWSQARKLVKCNPALAALPQLRFTPTTPSRYRIRRQPADHCVSTIEALARVLGALEGDEDRFQTLLSPFEAMVETQLRFATEVRGARGRHAAFRARQPDRPGLPSLLRERGADVVCLHGEANAWPVRIAGSPPPEIVHWIARRARTGETFEAVIAPRRAVAPATPRHIRIPAEQLAAGESWESFAQRWRAFARPEDVLCTWGRTPTDLLEREGISLAAARLDIRPVAGSRLGARTGTVEDCVARMGIAPPASFAIGRGGGRLAALCAIVDRLLSPGSTAV